MQHFTRLLIFLAVSFGVVRLPAQPANPPPAAPEQSQPVVLDPRTAPPVGSLTPEMERKARELLRGVRGGRPSQSTTETKAKSAEERAQEINRIEQEILRSKAERERNATTPAAAAPAPTPPPAVAPQATPPATVPPAAPPPPATVPPPVVAPPSNTAEAPSTSAEPVLDRKAQAKAEKEARKKAEAEAEARKQAEKEAHKQAEAEKEAQAKARKKAEAEAKAQAKAEKQRAKHDKAQTDQPSMSKSEPMTSDTLDLPISPAKRARLAELLDAYKKDQITPAQYQQERAKILAEP